MSSEDKSAAMVAVLEWAKEFQLPGVEEAVRRSLSGLVSAIERLNGQEVAEAIRAVFITELAQWLDGLPWDEMVTIRARAKHPGEFRVYFDDDAQLSPCGRAFDFPSDTVFDDVMLGSHAQRAAWAERLRRIAAQLEEG